MMKVSVIIPSFNRARKLIRAIASVLYQTFPHYEIIVVDDGSTDGTAEALTPFRAQIRYLCHPRNRGVSAARNAGIRAAQAPFLAFLDSDDYWFPQKLEKQVVFFQTHPEALICQTDEIWIRNQRRVNPWNKHHKPSGDIFEPSLERCLVSPSAVMLKKRLLDEIGLFDESLVVCEDYDLWLRTACRYPIYLISEFLLIKEGGAPDQLSALLKGMDQYRIQALVKLIKNQPLNNKQLQATLSELRQKCEIFGRGCLKHGREIEGRLYLELPDIIKKSIN
ncbi:MAG: glycosyltransferase family 2 protein [Desulfobacteraceae bacterium]|nr:MAG: glycosyltransferase family 2 protein [Desulfobacteraceae bacterium]